MTEELVTTGRFRHIHCGIGTASKGESSLLTVQEAGPVGLFFRNIGIGTFKLVTQRCVVNRWRRPQGPSDWRRVSNEREIDGTARLRRQG
jgi:hypothetical protein